jgi:serine/threonine protein kinase/tetratricopeptide (TPR) repeat protein
MIGKTISHYEILGKLGEGGMGVVYKAHDTKLDRTVALKFLPSHIGTDETEKRRFINEARAASTLDHSNICTIYSIEETDDGQIFIVMAYYEGMSLKEKIEQGPLPLKDVINYSIQIATGLQKAHEKEIVHRDLKPANIFITNDDQIKIIDFGLAKAAERSILTKSGTTLGTVPYMSPEQAQGNKVDNRTDIWSLGVVMYEMITGQRPFKSEYETALVYSIINEEPEPVTGLRSGIPLDLEKIIGKCMEKNPEDRYKHSDEIIVDLRKVERHLTSNMRSGISRPRIKMKNPSSPAEQDNIISTKNKISGHRIKRFAYGMPVLFLILLGFYFYFTQRTGSPEIERSIAVLPFENLSPNPDDAFFTAGVHEDIIIQLSKIEDLKVISRGSVLGYPSGVRDYRRIGSELGVSSLLDGSVRRDANRVRVSVNLIDAATNQTRWAERYDRDLTDLFYIQSDIAEEISKSLKANLSLREQTTIAHIPTYSTQAYDLYLRAREYMRRDYWNPDDFQIAIQLYERSIDNDPEFALAYAWQSIAHTFMYSLFDRSHERLDLAYSALQRANAISPDHPEVRMATGLYYSRGLNYFEKGLEEFTYALETMPNSSELYGYIATTQRRLGLWDEALKNDLRAYELDPRNFNSIYGLVHTYWNLREFDKVEPLLEKASMLFPDSDYVLDMIMWSDITSRGRPRYSMQDLLNQSHDFYFDRAGRWLLLYTIREFEFMIENKSKFPGDDIDSSWLYYSKHLLFGLMYKALGRDDDAYAYLDSARVNMEDLRNNHPDDPRIRIALGKTYAGLGFKEEALDEGKKAMALVPASKDAWLGVRMEVEMARIYSLLGEKEYALDYIERLLDVTTDIVTIGRLRTEPFWDPLRDDPRFQALVREK